MNRRIVPFVIGAVSFAAGAFLFYRYDGLWTYIVGVPLLMLGWGSLKTSIYASDKEIKELTGDGSASEETKNKFIDRM